MMSDALTLAIDGNEANVPNRVGSNVYAFEILHHLAQTVRRQQQLKVTVLLADQPVADLPPENEYWRYQLVTPRPLWTQWGLPLYLYQHRHDFDVFFTPGHYAPRFCPVPYVTSVMDLAFLYFPEQFRRSDLLQLKHWTSYSVKRAAKVVTISQFTKNDVIKQYRCSQDKVVVAYPGVSPGPSPKKHDVSRVRRRYQLGDDPYLVYVGTLQPRKNLLRLIEAYEGLRRQLASLAAKPSRGKSITTLKLVLVGRVGWLAEPIVDRAAASNFANDIVITGYVSQDDKQALIKGATSLTLVGLYEGFGIPALEALKLRTVPVVADTTSLPEVVGNAGIKVDPCSTNAIQRGLFKAVTLTKRQQTRYHQLGQRQVEQFCWEQSTQTVLDTILKAASKPATTDAIDKSLSLSSSSPGH